jgi:riboflavin-specific deaminase-like protein
MNSKLKIRNSKLPFVFSNFAMTADGKIAFADRTFTPFGSKRDREHMLELRATADAVLCGARTVESSQATLGTGGVKYRKQRLKRGLAEHPLRIIVTRSGAVNPNAEIFKHRFSPIIILTTKSAGARRLKKLGEVAEVKICGETEINFKAAFRWLRTKWNVKRLLCEGGGDIHGAIIRAGLLDELHLTLCPTVFGGRTAPTIAEGEAFKNLASATSLKLKSHKRVGDEAYIVFEV